jgi:hypothetical protein
MKSALISTARGATFIGLIGLAGCVYRVHGPAVEVSAEPVPAPYATVYYDPLYYDAGWYDGPYWYWYGPDHRLSHEVRDWHERRYYNHYHRHYR